MKKLLTLFTLLLTVCSGAWAGEISFAFANAYLSNTSGTNVAGTGCTINYASIGATSSGSNVSIQSGTYYFKFTNGSSSYIKITPTSGAFKAGDIITIDTYMSGKKSAYKIKSTSGNVVGESLSSGVQDVVYTLKAEDIDTDGKSITLYRADSGTYFHGISIDQTGLSISPSSGLYSGKATVTLTANAGYDIYYTMGASPADPTNASTPYTAPFDVTSTAIVKAIAYKSGESGPVKSATYTIVSENRKYDFTALTAADLLALQDNKDVFSDDTDNKIISNKTQWNSNTDYALEGSDGTDISVAQYLLLGRKDNNISAGNFKYYYGDSKYVYLNNSNTYVKIPAVKAGQKVILEMSAGANRTITATNTTVSELSYTPSGVKKVSFLASANGEVKLSFNGNLSIFSIEVKTPVYYHVTYDLDGGTGTTPTETDKEEGDKFNLHDGTTDITAPVGKEFDGWSDGTSTYAGGAEYTMPDDNVILTAQWRTVAAKYTVTYDLNGGSGTTPTETDKEEGDKFTLHDGVTDITAPVGKKFVAWNDGTKNYAGGAEYTMPGENVTLTAQWADKYTITVRNTENGTITASATEAVAGEEITLTATPDFKYVLGSWMVYKTFDTTTSTYVNSNNKFIMPAYNVTVDATFVADSRKQILYLTTTAKETTEANDKLYAALNSVDDYNVIIEAPASQTLTNYDLIVLHESIGGTSEATAVTGCKTTTRPVLNTKSYFYGADGDASKRWKWGAPNAGTSVKGATLNTAFSNIASHPIFAGVTISTNFFEITDEAAEKCMQPVGSFVAGKEGFTLATTPNKSTGDGAAIHELTPAQRGADSGKYLLISVSSAKLNALNENGQLLFKNAAAYLLSNDQWVPTVSATITAAKYATFASDYDLDFSNMDDEGLYAYTATVAGDKVTFTKVTGSTAAGEGLLLYSETAKTYNVPVATDSPEKVSENKLVRGTGAAVSSDGEGETKNYVLSSKGAGDVNFYLAAGNTVPTSKAYLKNIPTTTSSKFFLPTGEDETDGIKSVQGSRLTVNGEAYNLAGQKVGADYKGIVIVNGKKVIRK